jgi:hypothetical protein
MTPVADLIARFALALDDRDWDAVTRCLAGTVRRDYQSLTGVAPDDIAGPDLVAEWRAALTGLDGHQHLLGLPVVDVHGDGDGERDADSHGEREREGVQAHAAVHVVGTHILDGDPGSPWVVGGTYRFALRGDGDGWRITALTLDTRWQTGDGALLARAAARQG